MSKFFWFRSSHASHADGSKAFGDVVLGGDAKAVTLRDVAEDMTAYLCRKRIFLLSEGLILRHLELMVHLHCISFPTWLNT